MVGEPDKKPYAGILADPIPTWTFLAAPTDTELDALLETKMKALFTHYELDPTDAFQPGPKMAAAWANLTWRLAREHVPGFQRPPRKRGKPATRKNDDVDLAMYVELLKRRDGLSERKAISLVAAQQLVPGTEAALLQRYKRTKKQFAPMSRLFDNVITRIGRDVFIHIMENALFGDKKDLFLSPT